MVWFRRTPSRGRVGVSCRLRLESLESREQPDGMMGDPPPPPLPPDSPPVQNPPPVNAPPQIVDFDAEEVGNGLFVITGRVIDESPAGMIITLGGSTSASGTTITVNADGTFTAVVTLRTDGTDCGFITANTVDAQGLAAEEQEVFVSPTAP